MAGSGADTGDLKHSSLVGLPREKLPVLSSAEFMRLIHNATAAADRRLAWIGKAVTRALCVPLLLNSPVPWTHQEKPHIWPAIVALIGHKPSITHLLIAVIDTNQLNPISSDVWPRYSTLIESQDSLWCPASKRAARLATAHLFVSRLHEPCTVIL